jgi:hypothetical protein
MKYVVLLMVAMLFLGCQFFHNVSNDVVIMTVSFDHQPTDIEIETMVYEQFENVDHFTYRVMQDISWEFMETTFEYQYLVVGEIHLNVDKPEK